MATKGSDKFPKRAIGGGDVTQAELDQVSSDLTNLISHLETEINNVKNKEPEVSQLELDQASSELIIKITQIETELAELKNKEAEVTQIELDQTSSELNTKITELEKQLSELKNKEPDATQTELDQLSTELKDHITELETQLTELKAKDPEVTQLELDQLSTELKDQIALLQTDLTELKNKEPDVTEAELQKSVEDARAMIKAVEDTIAELKAKAPDVTKAELNAAVQELETSIAALPTTAQLDTVKTDVVAVQDKLANLDTDKADKTAVEAANTAIKDVDTALKALAALPPDVLQRELDAAVADYNAKLKTANDAIAALQADEVAYRTVGWGETLDFSAIKSNLAFSWAGATLSGGPLNSGSEGIGSGSYKGDDKNGTLSIVVLSAPDNRQIEGSWIATRTNGPLGDWTVAPKASDFIVTTGNRTVITGESVAIAVGHVVTLSYVDVTKSIKLKPYNTTWNKITQYVSDGFTVPSKPANGAAIVELKFDPGKGEWVAVVTADPLDTRIVAVEAKAAANETAIGGLDTRLKALEGLTYDIQEYALDGGNLFTFSEAAGLYDLVHIKSDGTAELANDKDQNKPADGIVIAPVASGGKAKIFGNGSRLADIGLTGINPGTIVYTGTSGDSSLSSTGSARLIQPVAVFRNGFYWFSFDDKGYWIA